jgi:poly-gamma-glutamate synthesis protein (capsule biosynthesis protein)
MQLSAATSTGTAPFTTTLIAGSAMSISAPDQLSSGIDYVFSSWSDGGAKTHTVTAPDSDTTYAATFVKRNHPPKAVVGADLMSGQIPLTVRFDASGSSDPDDEPLGYSWDLNGDGAFGDSTAVQPARTYRTAGSITVRLRVSDGRGASDTERATILPQKKWAPFHSSVVRISSALRERIVGSSWHRGCPVPVRKLRLVRVSLHKFNGTNSEGRMIVHRREAANVAVVMHKLYRAGYPIRHMRLVDAYGADAERSAAADNTSAFDCRHDARTSRWSMHAFGLAIDLNPVENPYVDGIEVSPAKGQPYADRSSIHPAVINAGDVVVRAFRSVGWDWGGRSAGAKNYEHFSVNGR